MILLYQPEQGIHNKDSHCDSRNRPPLRSRHAHGSSLYSVFIKIMVIVNLTIDKYITYLPTSQPREYNISREMT